MSVQMIENSDRGITINKALAWTMLVGILGGGYWVGTMIATATEGISTLEIRQTEDRAAIRENMRAINDLRSSNARVDERLTGIEQSAQRTEATVAEILRYLRDGARP